MSIIAAFRWEPSGKNGYISYMLLDDKNYRVIAEPVKIRITKNNKEEIKSALNNFFEAIQDSNNNQDEVTVEYKTVIRRAPNKAHRDDSAFIHKTLVDRIQKSGFKDNGRLLKDLDGCNLRIFKMKLRKLGIIDSARGTAWIHRLWAVALHVTPSTLRNKLSSFEAHIQGKRAPSS